MALKYDQKVLAFVEEFLVGACVIVQRAWNFIL